MHASGVVAVTGATGFLGSHLTERLVQEGLPVRLLARDPAKASRFERVAEAIAIGDITDRRALADVMEGADVVFHLVSNFRSTSDLPSRYHATNLEGTLAALDVAQAAGVRRFVHCSTIGVHGDVQHTPGDETSPYAPGDLYQETKVLAERACLERAANGGMEVVVVRPCSIYGPGDLRMLKMFKMLARRTFVVLEPCDANFHAVYIDDLVEGFIRAMRTPDIAGEAFIIGGPHYVPLREYIEAAARAVGAPSPAIRLPYGVMDAAAGVCERLCVPLRIRPPISRRRVRFFKNNRAFSIAKARERLAFVPKIGLDEGMRQTVAWYREQGYLR
jgi:nucleoside-diphosphate-sugar epimerase